MRVLMFSWCILLLSHASLHAFNPLVHEQIIKSVFRHLDTQKQTLPMLKNKHLQKQTERLLIRSTIDVDYQADLWMSAWYRSAFAGGQVRYLGMLTSLYHFTNVTKPGIFWQHDGYAYRHTDGTGNDAYLGMAGMKIRGDLSHPLGGFVYDDPQRRSMMYLGTYRADFKGSDQDWRRLFFERPSSEAVLPPSYVPAEKAYELFLSSKPAYKDKLEEWDGLLPVAVGYVFLKKVKHHYWRQEILGLPLALDRLGVVLHMLQDLGMPHHAQGLAGYCHPELEELADSLVCEAGKIPDLSRYQSGYFDSLPMPDCQKLYDFALVEDMLGSLQMRYADHQVKVRDILFEIAKESAKWRFGKFDKNLIATILPDKLLISGADCDVLKHDSIFKQIKFQYNLSVAYSLFFLSNSLRKWEILNRA